jgi:hypothetical protein
MNFKDDVKQSVNYIKHILQAPVAPERLKVEIKKIYKIMKNTPFIYPVVPNDYLASIGFRFTMVKNYMLFYIVEENQMNLLAPRGRQLARYLVSVPLFKRFVLSGNL